MVRLSIIIPVVEDEQALEDTLVSALANRPADCEVLVVHAGEYDDPYDLSDEVRFLELAPSLPLEHRMAEALEQAAGEVVHLMCGVEAAAGWTDAVLPHFADAQVASVTPYLQTSTAGRIVAGVACSAGGARKLKSGRSEKQAARAARGVLGPTACAAFYRRSAVLQAGGWPTLVGPELADIDLALALKTLGRRNVVEPDCRITAKAEFAAALSGRSAGAFRRGRTRQRLALRHAVAAGWLKSLAMHPFTAGWQTVTEDYSPLAMLGRLVGLFHLPAASRRHRQLLQRRAVSQAAVTAEHSAEPVVDQPHQRQRGAGLGSPRDDQSRAA